MSNQAWWRVVIVVCSLTVCGAAVACCILLRSEAPSKYESLTLKQDGFFGRFNRDTGEFERAELPPIRNPWDDDPIVKPAPTGWDQFPIVQAAPSGSK